MLMFYILIVNYWWAAGGVVVTELLLQCQYSYLSRNVQYSFTSVYIVVGAFNTICFQGHEIL